MDTLCRRRDAIYPATVVGKPRQEDFFIGDLLQELLAPLFPLVMPGVVDLWSYGETGYHSLAAAVVKERYKREAMASAFRILGEGQLSLTKFLLVVDRRVDLRDFRATLEHLLARTNPQTDLYVFSNLSMDTLDYTGPTVNEGSKGVWLGLGDPVRELPREFRPQTPPPPEVTDVRVFCGGCLVVGGPSAAEDPGAGPRLAAHPAFRGWPLLVLTDEPKRAAASPMNFLWTTFTRFEPAADVHAAATRVVRHHVVHEPPVLIDARTKPSFPKEVSCDPDTAALVSRRWKEYFPGGRVEMGDSERAHLDRRHPEELRPSHRCHPEEPRSAGLVRAEGSAAGRRIPRRLASSGTRCARSGRRLDWLLREVFVGSSAAMRIVAALCLCLAGAAVSGLLLMQHHGEGPAVSAVNQACGDGQTSGCEDVARSSWSRFAGLPVAAYGLAFYLSLVAGARAGARRARRDPRHARGPRRGRAGRSACSSTSCCSACRPSRSTPTASCAS